VHWFHTLILSLESPRVVAACAMSTVVHDVHGCPQWLLSPNLFGDESGDVTDHAVTPGVAASDLRRLESISTKPTVKQCPWCKNAPRSFSGLVRHAASEFHTKLCLECTHYVHSLEMRGCNGDATKTSNTSCTRVTTYKDDQKREIHTGSL
jgi:hypothetical protein